MGRPRGTARAVALAVLGGALLGLGSEAGPWLAPVAAHTQLIEVVAAENFWGSLAGQLGGSQVQVKSIVSDPNADPHEYEANSTDARAFARADYVILNGAGYDNWANRLLSAGSRPGRKVLTVATLLGKRAGDNPHFWYSPADVFRVIDQIAAAYRGLEPGAASYFAARHRAVESALSPYRKLLAEISHRFAGTPVAATESIFQYLAQYLRLDLVTSPAFMRAVSEGVDPPAASVAAFDQQIAAKRFRLLVFNRQTVSPLTTSIRLGAEARGIPTVAVSETIVPPRASFQQWMDGELEAIYQALAASPAPP